MNHSHDLNEYIENLGTRIFKKFGSEPARDSDQIEEKWSNDHEVSNGINDAELVTSRSDDGYHYPVLDLDIPAMLIKSSTEGHSHLYLNHPVPISKYIRLLDALVDCGIIEPGYRNAAVMRGYTAVRLPWVFKKKDNLSIEEKNNVQSDLATDRFVR